MIRVADFIAHWLANRGIKHVFMISGGGAMHLNDAIGREKRIQYICNHHEQASAIAAEGYARISGSPAVVIVTTGPGGLNTLTGVMGQWTDSVPVVYISGQVKFSTTTASCPEILLRQLGDQEVDIIKIVAPLTKFSHMLTKPEDVSAVLEQAFLVATSGRPGPVWIDIPLDVQGAVIDEKNLSGDAAILAHPDDDTNLSELADRALTFVLEAERPVVIAGHGIRIAGARQALLRMLTRTGIPVVSTFNAIDLIPADFPNYIGRIGTVGDRAGNFCLQNADLILSLGSRNNIRQISYNWDCFGHAAKRIVVDIDEAELCKPTVKPDLPIRGDVGTFLSAFEQKMKHRTVEPERFKGWLDWALERKRKYPIVSGLEENTPGKVNLYVFVKKMTECLPPDAIVVAGNGSACVGAFQASVVKDGQRFFWNSGCAAMGFDLPAAIGACFAANRNPVYCLAGDGSIQMNLQELQTIVHHALPVKIFYLNNDGYTSIKQTQDSFFNGRRTACSPATGVTFPDIAKISSAYGIPYYSIGNHEEISEILASIMAEGSPCICEVNLDPEMTFCPKVSSQKLPDGRIISKPLEDMFPFLAEKELRENMIESPVEEG